MQLFHTLCGFPGVRDCLAFSFTMMGGRQSYSFDHVQITKKTGKAKKDRRRSSDVVRVVGGRFCRTEGDFDGFTSNPSTRPVFDVAKSKRVAVRSLDDVLHLSRAFQNAKNIQGVEVVGILLNPSSEIVCVS